MDAGIEHLTAGKGIVHSGPGHVSHRRVSKQSARASDCADVPCAFCHGTGTDPFGIMSWGSQCCVCDGKGVTQVRGLQESCAHCRGSGAIKTFTCTVCGGKGLMPLRARDAVVCPECQGTGDDLSASAMPCLKCCGLGWVALDA
jgi:DnaJ-class molecular chaperone